MARRGSNGGDGDVALFFVATLLLLASRLRSRWASTSGTSSSPGSSSSNRRIGSSASPSPGRSGLRQHLHSTVISASVVFVLVNQRIKEGLSNMFEHAQLLGGTWLGAYSALCFSCGYFAYDQLDMHRYRLCSGRIPAILVHHLILLVCFTLNLSRNVTINYLVLSLVCELHSIFLHLRKVRWMAGAYDFKSRMVKVEWMLNWATFFIARLVCHILITYKLIVDTRKFGRGIELPLALFGMAGMNLLNIFLGLDLFKAYKRERNQ